MSKILIVDDDPATTRLLEIMLSREGYEVVSVNESSDTLSAAVDHNPNLILLDVMMPSIDGFEVCRNLRANAQFTNVPIIFFTSVGETEKKVEAFQFGATDYIVKPIHPRELKLRIKVLIGNGNNGNHR
ncbi:MAG TPA: response regulator [Anaerolineales bacterium]|nr:response regulator [Anaerolineales bacterium]